MHVDADQENPLPYKMPAFGLAAVPSPTKNRNTAPGYQPATGEPAADPDAVTGDNPGSPGSPLDTCAAGATVRDRALNSRRLAAATVHASGAATGPSPEPPRANHANTSSLRPRTPPASAAGAGALITGADAYASEATSTSAIPTEPPLTASDESTSGASESTAESEKSDGDRPTESEFTPAASLAPDTTEPGRG